MTQVRKPATIVCRECGTPTPAGCGEHRRDAKFCSVKCKSDFNNRRKKRGSEVYDLWMAMRYERDDAKRLGLWGELCRLSENWYDEDQRERKGRKSYSPPAEALQRLRDRGAIRIGTVITNNAAGVRRR